MSSLTCFFICETEKLTSEGTVSGNVCKALISVQAAASSQDMFVSVILPPLFLTFFLVSAASFQTQ